MSAPGSALRATAARVLGTVLGEGRSLKAVLGRALPEIPDARDRALLEAICFDALRHRRRYEFALSKWLIKPLPPRDGAIHALLLAGLAQLKGLGLPPHAAVGASAEAARELGRPALVGPPVLLADGFEAIEDDGIVAGAIAFAEGEAAV